MMKLSEIKNLANNFMTKNWKIVCQMWTFYGVI